MTDIIPIMLNAPPLAVFDPPPTQVGVVHLAHSGVKATPEDTVGFETILGEDVVLSPPLKELETLLLANEGKPKEVPEKLRIAILNAGPSAAQLALLVSRLKDSGLDIETLSEDDSLVMRPPWPKEGRTIPAPVLHGSDTMRQIRREEFRNSLKQTSRDFEQLLLSKKPLTKSGEMRQRMKRQRLKK